MSDPKDGPWEGATEHDSPEIGDDPPTVRATLAQRVSVRAAARLPVTTLPPPGATRTPAAVEVILLDTVSSNTPTDAMPQRGEAAAGGLVVVATGTDGERIRKLCHQHGLLVPVMASLDIVHEAMQVVVIGEPSPPAPERVVHVVRPAISDVQLLALLRSLVDGRVGVEPAASAGDDEPHVAEAAQRLASLDDRTAIEASAVETILVLTDADRAHCLFHDPQTGALWSERLRNGGGDDRRAMGGLVGWAAQTGESIYASPAGDDPRWFLDLDDPEGKAQSRVLVQPVIGADRRVHAVLVAARRWSRQPFTDEARTRLARFAALSAPVMDLASTDPRGSGDRRSRSTEHGIVGRPTAGSEAARHAAVVDPRAKRPSDGRAGSDSRPPPVTAQRAKDSRPPPIASPVAVATSATASSVAPAATVPIANRTATPVTGTPTASQTATPVAATPKMKRTATPVAGTPLASMPIASRTATPVAGTSRTATPVAGIPAASRTATPVAGIPAASRTATPVAGMPTATTTSRTKSDSAGKSRPGEGEPHEVAVVTTDPDAVARVKRLAKKTRIEVAILPTAAEVPAYYRIVLLGEAWSPDADPRVVYVARDTMTDDQLADLLTSLTTDRSVVPALAIAAPHGAAEARRAQLAFAGSRKLAAATSLADAEAVAVATLRELLDADRAYCLYFDSADGALWSATRKRAGGDDRHAIAGITGWAARTGRTAAVSRASADPRWLGPLDDPDGDPHSQLIVQPLVAADRRVRGVLVAARRPKVPGFSDLDAALLARFAALIAPLIEQLVIHVETQRVLGDDTASRAPLTMRSSAKDLLAHAPKWAFAAAGAVLMLLLVLIARC